MNAEILSIKSEIKNLAVELRGLKLSIKDHNRNSRWERLWSDIGKRRLNARRCRHLLIAYGLLRGMKYERIECPREGNEPDWKAVEEIQNVSAAA